MPVVIPSDKLVLKQSSTTKSHYNHNFIIPMYQVSIYKQCDNLKGNHRELLSDSAALHCFAGTLQVCSHMKVTYTNIILLTPSDKAVHLIKSMP